MSNSLARWVSGGIVLGMAGFLGVVLTDHMQSRHAPAVLPTPVADNADASLEGFVYRQTESGEIHWEVEARKARVDESQQRTMLEDVQVRLFGSHGRQLEVKADEGMIDTATRTVDLRNRHDVIEVALDNGYTIRSPHIRWDDHAHALRTRQPVDIRGHGLTITGIGLLCTLRPKRLTVLDDVRVRMASPI